MHINEPYCGLFMTLARLYCQSNFKFAVKIRFEVDYHIGVDYYFALVHEFED